jgi:hypothetical protein
MLSICRMDRTVGNLRESGLIRGTQSVTVHDWLGLMKLAQFDHSYLNELD